VPAGRAWNVDGTPLEAALLLPGAVPGRPGGGGRIGGTAPADSNRATTERQGPCPARNVTRRLTPRSAMGGGSRRETNSPAGLNFSGHPNAEHVGHVVDRLVAHVGAGLRRVQDLAVAGVEADVVQVAVEEDQVPGGELTLRVDPLTDVGLRLRGARQGD